jgi:hypothetical protein
MVLWPEIWELNFEKLQQDRQSSSCVHFAAPLCPFLVSDSALAKGPLKGPMPFLTSTLLLSLRSLHAFVLLSQIPLPYKLVYDVYRLALRAETRRCPAGRRGLATGRSALMTLHADETATG